jgi:hypothetical protein
MISYHSMIAAAAASGAGGAGLQLRLQGPERAGRTRTAAAGPRFQDAETTWNRGISVATNKTRTLTLARVQVGAQASGCERLAALEGRIGRRRRQALEWQALRLAQRIY